MPRRRIPTWIWLALALGAGAGALWCCGPRPVVPPGPTRPVAVPADGPAWLAEREARVLGLRPGLGAHVVWADPARRARTPLAIVYLHGFSASPLEMSPVIEQLAARQGANALLMRLGGHGQDGEALAAATVGDWFADAEEALALARQLGERVVFVGMSTGGTLALWLAARHPEIAGLVLLSPNLGLRDGRAGIFRLPFGTALIARFVASHREWQPHNELEAQRWTSRYPVAALATMVALVAHVRGLPLSRIRQPTLVLYSPFDPVIDTDAVVQRLRALPAARIEVFEPVRGHVLGGEADAPQGTAPLVEALDAFLRAQGLSAPAAPAG